jgi:hypothetical protein
LLSIIVCRLETHYLQNIHKISHLQAAFAMQDNLVATYVVALQAAIAENHCKGF